MKLNLKLILKIIASAITAILGVIGAQEVAAMIQ